MDIDDEDSFTKKCYKCEEPVLDNLDIVYNSSNSKLILWNKYQIFVYGEIDFQCIEKIFIPEFQIHNLIASNNFLLCLDCEDNVHIHSLKFKSSTQKTLKIPFQSRNQGVKTCIRYKEDHILSLKYEAETYFLCLHEINSDFHLEKKVILLCGTEHWPLGQHSKEKHLMTSYAINKQHFEHLNKIFKSEEPFQSVTELVVLSIDKLNVYACLFSPKMSTDEISLIKLYSCPAEICNMQVLDSGDMYLLIGLTTGTIIRLPLIDILKTPDIVHLNAALYKMLALKDNLIYSDGTTMWKAENAFSNLILTQLFIKNPNDFVKCRDQIICTTFSKLIYKFSLDDQSAYFFPEKNEYCSAEKLFNNTDYLNKLFEEIDKNNEIVKRMEKEQHYITVLSLSKRQDVVNKAINSSIKVFESYEKENKEECTLTEHVKEYFDTDTWIFLVSISNSGIYDAINSILIHLSDNVKIYITLSTNGKILKTTCIKMVEPLKTVNYLIPLKMADEIEVNVNIKIVINIPRALDQRKALTVLYKNDIIVSSEHFIKTNQKSIQSLNNSTESIVELIKKINIAQYGNIFNFTNISELHSELEHTFYLKLPKDFKQVLKVGHSKYLLQKTLILQELSTDEFLKSKKSVIFSIGYEKVKVLVHNDGFSNPLLKISSENPKVALNMRNFFAKLIYNNYEGCKPGKELIGYSLYTTTENFQKALKSCIKRSTGDFLPLMEQFEKNIIGALPL